MSPFSLLRRVPPGVWTAVIWCASTAWSLREFSGIPGMPHVPFGLKPSTGLVMVLATATAVAGSAVLRRRPLAAAALLTAGSIAAGLALGSPTILLAHYLAVDVALGVTVAGQPRPTRIAALAITLGALPCYVLARVALGTSHSQASEWAFYVLTAVVAWLAGDSVRRAREYAERLRAHAAAEAITAERLRISRELHDMVAHSLGIMTLQAGAAARVIDTQPQSARDALHEVESAGREVLAGLRRMLGALRQAEPGQPAPGQAGPGQGDQTVLGSMPGLADIERLAAATTAAGVRVDVQWRGERRPLPPDIDLAATASSRNPSPTSSATPASDPARCSSPTTTRRWRSRSPTAGTAAAAAPRGPDMAAPRGPDAVWPECASASPCCAESSAPRRSQRAASS